ncbi:hypothetical protein [Streptomyces sp. 2A115]|uniref:hypothetical protein n=1 Tax=Streptomyces sp. 2A115 TaxID=3457439 RepID=UPI003FD1F32C
MFADLDRIPKPVVEGPEMEVLARFCRDMAWTGIVEAGGMGPGTPAMTARGSGRQERIQDGRWIVGTCEQDQFLLDGTPIGAPGLTVTPGRRQAVLAGTGVPHDVVRHPGPVDSRCGWAGWPGRGPGQTLPARPLWCDAGHEEQTENDRE